MPRALSNFQTGKKVQMLCSEKECDGVLIDVTLGKDLSHFLSFGYLGSRLGRIKFPSGSNKLFCLGKHCCGGSGFCQCPNCGVSFEHVLIFSKGSGQRPLVVGCIYAWALHNPLY